jgi:hypothetical protein
MESTLDGPLQDLRDAIDDYRTASSSNPEQVIGRFVAALDAEPLAGFLRSILPVVDLEEWAKTSLKRGGMAGSGEMAFPADRAQRVALQIALVRDLAGAPKEFLGFVTTYTCAHLDRYTYDFEKFADMVLEAILRDIERLAERRAVPPVIFEALGTLPASGDATVDELLREAIEKFKDAAPQTRKAGLERLWDAWERLKTLGTSGNKKMSSAALLDAAATERRFREVLEAEALALTKVGNDFHIRHFETNRSPLTDAAQVDYLFHRMFALLHLLLFSRNAQSGP